MADLIKKIPPAYEPKRKNRWVLRLDDGKEVKEWVIHKACRPRLLKKKKFFIGSYFEPQEMKFSLRDPINPSTAKCLYNLVSQDKVIDMTLEMLDPTGVVVEKWVILDCEILEVDFGELNYADDGIMDIQLKVKPKSAELIY